MNYFHLCGKIKNSDKGMANHFLKQFSPLLKATFYVSMFLLMVSFSTALASAVVMYYYDIPTEELKTFMKDYESLQTVRGLSIINMVSQVGGFLGSALLFAVFFGAKSIDRFWIKKPSHLIFLVPIITLSCFSLIEITASINEWLIPAGSWIESFAKPLEDEAAKITEAFMQMPDTRSFLLNVFLVALIPAVCEEFAFRGVIQSLVAKASKNVHIGIWVAAFVFSLIHFQFYGFIPRLILGALFGYLLIWTGSIWASVLAHFTNNFVAVLSIYYYQKNTEIPENYLEDQSMGLVPIIISLAILVALCWLMYKNGGWRGIKKEYLHVEKPEAFF